MMDNTINGRTPEEIKKGLADSIEKAGWDIDCGDTGDLLWSLEKANESMIDALALIQQLERERDAAVEILHDFKICAGCDHKGCADCRWFDDMTMKNKDLRDHWQWRGVQEVE